MEKLIDISNRAVADYGFRQAVLYGAQDISRRTGLSEREKEVLEGTVMGLLAALPVPVPPADIARQQIRLADRVRTAWSG